MPTEDSDASDEPSLKRKAVAAAQARILRLIAEAVLVDLRNARPLGSEQVSTVPDD